MRMAPFRLSRHAMIALLATGVSCSKAPAPASTPTPAPAPQRTPAQAPNSTPAGTPQTPPAATPPQQAPPPTGGDPAPRPYDRVVTAQAKSRNGLMKTHRLGSRLLFEIPNSLLGKDLIIVPRMAKAFEGLQGGSLTASAIIVRWERVDNRVTLRQYRFGLVADPSNPIAQAVRNSNSSPILGVFTVDAYGPDSSMVVDVTRFFTSPTSELSAFNAIRGQPDPTRSYIERAASYPTNVEVEATLTYGPPPTPGQAGNPAFGFADPPQTQTLVMHWSIVLAPEKPMTPRLLDSRVGYFNIAQEDYGLPEHGTAQRSYINRYRLEKKDPNAAISEPIKPITYYVDPATPKWLIPYVKKGIEAWQPAFETAGFRNAIVAKDAPTPQEDPDWSPEDARYSVVRWLATNIQNAVGMLVADPRSGEIIEADVYMFHNIMEGLRDMYFGQVGHLDRRTWKYPFPDSLMGALVQMVVTHEVGHTLGFPHNHKASATYPVDSVRSKTWTKRMGHSPSIMDYSRFNYVAQPEDSIALADLWPRIGAYDHFATMYGYKPIPGARTPEEEKATLNQWLRMQDTIPWYRYNVTGVSNADPSAQTEAVGDADPVYATTYGIKNLRRTVPLVLNAATSEGDDYSVLNSAYSNLIGQWRLELTHVTTDVGGTFALEKHAGQAGVRFEPLPRARQKRAVKFLNDNAFTTPTFFLDKDILRRIEVDGALRRINQAQAGILNSLLNDRRMERLAEQAAFDNTRDAYTLAEMLSDVRNGIWSELAAPRVQVDAFRRELQRSYLTIANAKLNPAPLPPGFPAAFGPARSTSDVRSLFRAELRSLDAALNAAVGRAGDRTTRAHLEDARAQIDRILNPR